MSREQKISELETRACYMGSNLSGQLDEEEVEYLLDVGNMLTHTMVKLEDGELVGLQDRLQLITEGELIELAKFFPLEDSLLVEDVSIDSDCQSEIYDFIGDVDWVSVWKFGLQPDAENVDLVFVCILCVGSGSRDYAVGLVTNDEFDVFFDGLVTDKNKALLG